MQKRGKRLTAAKRRWGLLELRKSCRTVMAGVISRFVTSGMVQIALQASNITRSDLFRRHDSR